MDEEVKQEFKKVWTEIKKIKREILSEEKKEPKFKKDGKSILRRILKSPLRLTDYPVDRFKEAMDKCLFALKLAKSTGIEEYLLTIDIRLILKEKLRTTNIPSMTAISNAMRKAEKKGFVISLPLESKEKRQREYKINKDGERYLSDLLNKNEKSK